MAGSGFVTLGTGTLTLNQDVDTTFSGVLSGSGGLIKNSTGVLTLTGANTYTGPTDVNAGVLAIDAAMESSFLSLKTGRTAR